jgi:hypothetical protein
MEALQNEDPSVEYCPSAQLIIAPFMQYVPAGQRVQILELLME